MIDWSRVTKTKEIDLDGKKVERVVYIGEKNPCSKCRFAVIEENKVRKFLVCSKIDKRRFNTWIYACVMFEPKTS